MLLRSNLLPRYKTRIASSPSTLRTTPSRLSLLCTANPIVAHPRDRSKGQHRWKAARRPLHHRDVLMNPFDERVEGRLPLVVQGAGLAVLQCK